MLKLVGFYLPHRSTLHHSAISSSFRQVASVTDRKFLSGYRNQTLPWVYCSKYKRPPCGSSEFVAFWDSIKMLEEPQMCSSRILSSYREESWDEELSVLPRHTKVIVTGNNRTKSVLVGLQGVVKKAVGLGGWHWLVLKNGDEVKLQRNALSVLEHPSGNEEDDDLDLDSSSGSDTGGKDHNFPNAVNFPKISKPRVRHTRPCSTSASCKPVNRGMYRDVQSIIQSPQLRVNLARLGVDSLLKYCKYYKLGSVTSNTSREEMLSAAERHFSFHQQRLSEAQVIMNFVRAAKRLKSGPL